MRSQPTLLRLKLKLVFAFQPFFYEFCSRWNGGSTGSENEFYPVPPSFTEFFNEYRKAKDVLVDKLLGATGEFLQCSLFRQYTHFGGAEFGIIPLSVDVFGNRAVLRADSTDGLIYWWDHELWEQSSDPDASGNLAARPWLIPIAESLEYFYNSLTVDPDM